MKKFIIFLLLSFIILFSSCSTSKYSFKSGGENTSLTYKEIPIINPKSANALISTDLIVSAIQVGAKFASIKLEKASKNYAATYSSSMIINLKEANAFDTIGSLYFTRQIVTKKENEENDFHYGEELAYRQEIKINTLEGGFVFVPSVPELIFSKCKASKKDSTIDIVISIQIQAAWTDKNGNPHNKIINKDEFILSNIYYNDYLESLQKTNPDLVADYKKQINDKIATSSKIIPYPYRTGNEYSYKTFKITVTIVETDDMGERLKSIAEFLGDNSEAIGTGLGSMYGSEE